MGIHSTLQSVTSNKPIMPKRLVTKSQIEPTVNRKINNPRILSNSEFVETYLSQIKNNNPNNNSCNKQKYHHE